MRFAIISDIHGNLPALNAVLEDAEKACADAFIFVGDYCLSNPFPDACIARIRALDRAYVIRGNEERYLENLVGKDQSRWTDGQMQISYWVYRNVTPENRNYLFSLPARIDMDCHGVSLHVAHSSTEFIADREQNEWCTSKVAERYRDGAIRPGTLGKDIRAYLDRAREFQHMFAAMEDGVYIFGHTHIQWSYSSEDEKKLLINPGSCGLPLDCVEDGVPYTILDISDKGALHAEERRVCFDKEAHIKCLLNSDQYDKARVWTKVIVQEWKTNREHMTFFLNFADEYAAKIGDQKRPFSVSTWEQAYALWANECRI